MAVTGGIRTPVIARYRDLLLAVQYEEALEWANQEHIEIGRVGSVFFARLPGNPRRPEAWYLARVDATLYPVRPFSVGFINPSTNRESWSLAHSRDPRQWPFSFSPGLHGSFHIVYGGAYRMFWCRECTSEFFFYHGDQPWDAGLWRLPRVLRHLQQAVALAEHPDQWRPLHGARVRQFAQQRGIALPDNAGTGDL